MVDLHRHDEGSTFDGFGKPYELAEIAKELGYTSLGISNHGNTNTLVQHYDACHEFGIKPIMGVEGYFLPKYKPQTRGYHLCVFAETLEGYKNINTIQYEGEKQKYYNPIWTFDLLEKYSDGLIVTSACVASYLSQCIIADKIKQAEMYVKKMVEIFADNFYIEVQPYPVSEKGLQEKINVKSIEIADKFGVKCILTSDSHRGKKEEFDTYMKMHEIAGHNFDDIEATYSERYMPTQKELMVRFYKMHKDDFGEMESKAMAKEMIRNLKEIEDKVDGDMFDTLTESLPVFDESQDSEKLLYDNVMQGLKDRGKWKKAYVKRAKEELDVIYHHKFADYFLMVSDYVSWAKDNGIVVGPGRGSGCNYIVNYALRITDVDSLKFKLEPRRFLMKERKKMPDIDIDFETDRRGEVIDYLLKKYKGHAARICSYGLYKVDNLVNDLAPKCGLPTSGKDILKEEINANKTIVAGIKSHINSFIEDGVLDKEKLANHEQSKQYNKEYDNIIKHFVKLYGKIRFVGTHAAGVAITGGNILQYTAIRIDKKGDLYTNYDLNDMERIKVIKFDMLGLKTESEIKDCRQYTGISDFKEEMITDEKVIEGFSTGNCDGVFQLDKHSVQDLLVSIHTSCFNDVVAATAMNRPGPLSQKMPEIYAANKELYEKGEETEGSYYDKWLGKTYGTIIYQEQIMQMAVDIAGMTWDEAHKITKMKFGITKFADYFENDYPRFEQQFVDGSKKLGVPEDIARETFKKFYNYSFNEGHSVGYSLVSAEQMYYKVHYPSVFWYSKMKYASNESNYFKFCRNAVKDGGVLFLPHVNYSHPKTRLRKVDGELCIQQGLADIKGVGEVAAEFIMEERKKNGPFLSYDDFYDRCKGRQVNTGTMDKLVESGALEFSKKVYISRVTKYNSSMFARK